MTTIDAEVASGELTAGEQAPPRRAGVIALVAVCLVSVLVVAGAVGYLLHSQSSSTAVATPAADSVDAGFSRDMATHHTQAVSMAGYTRDNSSDPAVKLLAFDIETSQQFQLGQMDGWLTSWGLGRTSDLPEMSWMGSSMQMQSNGLMPGLATQAEVAKLKTLKGKALDIYFLQLMLRHHQGGVQMAQYAAEHAETDYVRTTAQAMVAAQQNEIIEMEQMLRERGAAPLPATS
ncbi:Uncharacterized conserved protein, DUF305 family [Frankineae bacterium MT45]|nr:Uncharacterized conserved protein, DUF305 family [Frankineae bacterium MT45]